MYDLNSLVNLRHLYRERSVTKAAAAAGISQPSMSRALSRLREEYNDRLFIHQQNGLVPTDKAELIIASISDSLDMLLMNLNEMDVSAPSEAMGAFRFCAPDFVSKYAMAKLPSGILSKTPNIQFSYQYWQGDVSEQLQEGSIDLAFGQLEDHPNNIKKTLLAQDRYVIVHRPDHPILANNGSDIGLDQLLHYPHVAFTESAFSDRFVDRFLASRGLARTRIVNTVDIQAGFSLVMQSDCLAVVPEQLTRYLAQDIAVLPLMLPAPTVEYCLYWGLVSDRNPTHVFIRDVIRKTFDSEWPMQ